MIFQILRFYPYIAISLIIVVVEIGRFYRRRHSKAEWVFWGIAGFLSLTTLCWLIFRGDKYSDDWGKRLSSQSRTVLKIERS